MSGMAPSLAQTDMTQPLVQAVSSRAVDRDPDATTSQDQSTGPPLKHRGGLLMQASIHRFCLLQRRARLLGKN